VLNHLIKTKVFIITTMGKAVQQTSTALRSTTNSAKYTQNNVRVIIHSSWSSSTNCVR